MPHLDGLRVIRSKIHGYGLVALRSFKKGEILVYADGVLWGEDDDFDDTYALVYSDDDDKEEYPNRYLDLTDQTRWINHACSPNAEVDTDINPESGQPHAWWIATRNIKKGEELTYDYAFSGHLAEPCNCKDKVCIGLIVDPHDIDDVPKKLKPLIKKNRIKARIAAM